MLLLYADGIDKLLTFNVRGCYPGAFVFGAVRIMITVAVENMELFQNLSARFQDVNMRLERYLNGVRKTNNITLTSIRVMIDIARFCGRVTKYMKSNKSIIFCFYTLIKLQGIFGGDLYSERMT